MIGTPRIGLALSEKGLRAVALKKHRRQTLVSGWLSRSWPGEILKPAFRENNVIAEEPFVAAVRETLATLGVKKGRLALSLSDVAGRMLVTTLNEPLKRGSEGINLLKWQIREQLLLDPEQIRLACQVIDTQPGGKTRVLVAAANGMVLEQYENLLAAAGAIPVMILFDSMNLMHFYHSKEVVSGDHLLVILSSAALTLLLFRDNRLQACRCRPAPFSEKKLFQEVGLTLADWERSWPEAARIPAYVHCANELDRWKNALEGALGRTPRVPPEHPLRLTPGLETPAGTFSDYYAAIGGAERLFGVWP